MTQHLQDEIEEAQRVLAIHQRKVTKPEATLEDEWSLERARNRLATAENKLLKAENTELKRRLRDAGRKDNGHTTGKGTVRQPGHHLSARERAEAKWVKLSLPTAEANDVNSI